MLYPNSGLFDNSPTNDPYNVKKCFTLMVNCLTALLQKQVFSPHFGNMTQPPELGIFVPFFTELGNFHTILFYQIKQKIKYLVYTHLNIWNVKTLSDVAQCS